MRTKNKMEVIKDLEAMAKRKRHKLFEESDMERKSKDDNHYGRITINVGGQRHETYLTTLRNHPDTRLYWITEQHYTSTKSPEYNAEKKEYFFDRHPGVFSHIVNYYRTGKLHCPMDVCGPLFEEELSFWGIDERQVELCCWENYKQHKEKQEKLKYFSSLNESCECDDDDDELIDTWKIVKKKGLTLLEKPASSIPAKIINMINLLTFLVMVVQFCLTTLKSFKYNSHRTEILSGIRAFAATWFILDFLLRLLFCSSLAEHFKRIINWFDLVSVCALVVHVKVHHASGETEISPFEMLIFLKAARLSKLLTFSFVIQVLANTLKASSRELCLLTIIVLFQAFVFSTVLFFIERDEIMSKFESVPQSLWWAIITMTTVGYGDIKPTTWMGQILGCCCALCGVLVIALPVSVVATNFSLYYTYAKARLNLPPKADQKVPLPKELTSLKAKKDELGHSIVNHSCASIATKKHEPSNRASMESILVEHDEKPPDLPLNKLNSSDKRRHDSANNERDSPLPKAGENTLGGTTDELTPSFQEFTFDFLDVPKHKQISKSFLSSSLSRVFGAKAPIPENRLLLDVHSTYPLYSRRGAVTPGSVSSRSISSTIYDSNSSHLQSCVRRSIEALRNKQRLKRAGKWNSTRKCASNAELHLVCFHHCEQHQKNASRTDHTGNRVHGAASTEDCRCHSQNLPHHTKPRNAKSCSELNDILHGRYRRNSYYSTARSDHLLSSGDIGQRQSDSVQFSEVAITINGCSSDDEGLVTNGHHGSLPGDDNRNHSTNQKLLTPLGNFTYNLQGSAGT